MLKGTDLWVSCVTSFWVKWSRKNKFEQGQVQDVLMVCAALIKSRLLVNFCFDRATETIKNV